MHFRNFLKKFFENFQNSPAFRGAPPPDPHKSDPQNVFPQTKILATPMTQGNNFVQIQEKFLNECEGSLKIFYAFNELVITMKKVY